MSPRSCKKQKHSLFEGHSRLDTYHHDLRDAHRTRKSLVEDNNNAAHRRNKKYVRGRQSGCQTAFLGFWRIFCFPASIALLYAALGSPRFFIAKSCSSSRMFAASKKLNNRNRHRHRQASQKHAHHEISRCFNHDTVVTPVKTYDCASLLSYPFQTCWKRT